MKKDEQEANKRGFIKRPWIYGTLASEQDEHDFSSSKNRVKKKYMRNDKKGGGDDA